MKFRPKNKVREDLQMEIRKAYAHLLRMGLACGDAITKIAEDPKVNKLAYSRLYIRDIVYRVDPTKITRRVRAG